MMQRIKQKCFFSVNIVSWWLKRSLLVQLVYSQRLAQRSLLFQLVHSQLVAQEVAASSVSIQLAGGSRGRCYFSQYIVSWWLKRSMLFQLVHSQLVAQEVAASSVSIQLSVGSEVAAISVSIVNEWLKRALLFQLVQLAGGSRSRCYFSQYSQRVAQEVAAISVSTQLAGGSRGRCQFSQYIVSGWLIGRCYFSQYS